MACRDVWNIWHEGLRSPQNPTAKPEGFVATGGPRNGIHVAYVETQTSNVHDV